MRYPVDTPEAAAKMIDKLAAIDLTDNRVWGNAFGLEYYDENDDDWYEWYSEEGDEDILDVIDKQKGN